MNFFSEPYFPYGIMFLYSLVGFLVGFIHLFREWRKNKSTDNFMPLMMWTLFYVVALGQAILSK